MPPPSLATVAALEIPRVSFTHSGAVAPTSAKHIPAELPSREAFPPCLWGVLDRLCQTPTWGGKSRSREVRAKIHAEWSDGVRCITADGERAGYLRRRRGGDHAELETALLRGCAPDDEVYEPPPIGQSSLPLEALEQGASGGVLDPGLKRARAKLASNGGSLSILALGASVTALFANVCNEDAYQDQHCTTGANESFTAFDGRMRRYVRWHRGFRKHQEQTDWLLQLLLTLKRSHPHATLSVRSLAYGGSNPRSMAACAADFLTPPRARATAGVDSSRQGRASPPPWQPDVVLMDFAIFGGVHPDYIVDAEGIELLLRALWQFDAAIVLLNMPVWCFDRNGRRNTGVYQHITCARMIHHRQHSRQHVANVALPERWDETLTQLARHYNLSAVSVFSALQPLIVQGKLDLVDFTHDGKHPISFPRGTRRGAVYSRYIADLIAFTLTPRSLAALPGGAVWRGRPWEEAPRRLDGNTLSSTSSSSITLLPQNHRPIRVRPALPVAFTPRLRDVESRGVRCYGWAARQASGWAAIVQQSAGWNATNEELAYDLSTRAWRPIPAGGRPSKPGLTSVVPGDSMVLQVDTTLASGSTATGSNSNRELSTLWLTYLQSYDQTGVVRIDCISGCHCEPQTLQTLVHDRLATLNTTLWHVSESARCTLRFTNISPRTCTAAQPAADGSTPPCTKVKLVSLAVGAVTSRFNASANQEHATFTYDRTRLNALPF